MKRTFRILWYVSIGLISSVALVSCPGPVSGEGNTAEPVIARSDSGGSYDLEYHLPHISIYLTDPLSDPTMDDALIDLINAQTSSTHLDLAFYGLNRENVIQAIEAAIARGVPVRFVGNRDSGEDYYDGYLRIAHALDARFGGSRAADPEGAHADFRLVNGSAIMHNKFAIVTDGAGERYLYMGTTNTTDTGFERNNNNAIIFNDTAIAEHYRDQFEHLLGISAAPVDTVGRFTIDGVAVDVFFSPQETDGLSAMDHLMAAAGGASSSIHFMIFSFPYMPLNLLMLEQHDAGVDVMGVVDKSQGNNSAEEYLAQHGVPIRIDGNEHSVGVHGGKLHHKTMIIDSGEGDAIVVTGSFNWSDNANENNDENFIFIHSQQIAQFFEAEFARRWREANAVPTVVNVGDHAAYQDVVISEVMWMGARRNDGTATFTQEFIELRNTTSATIDLSGWSIVGAAMSRKPIVLPEGAYILPNRYLVVMDEYPGVGSYAYDPPLYLRHDQVRVTNSAMQLILEDPDRTVIDYAGDGSSAAAFRGVNGGGSEGDKRSMARSVPVTDGRNSSSWFDTAIQTNIDGAYADHTFGTPGADNATGLLPIGERDIVISEIAWAGTNVSAADEWIELYNRSGMDILFDSRWELNTVDGGLTVNLVGATLPAGRHLLLERTNDDSVPGKAADVIYTGSLANGGDPIVLRYNAQEVDRTPATWTAGSNSPKLAMERTSLGDDGSLSTSWGTAASAYGGAQNSGE